MKKSELKIGLALSGGGMRAAVYHLGILKYLARQHLLSKVTHISSVSGASLCMGMIYSCNGNTWPNDEQFLNKVLPIIERDIICKDIQWTSIIRLLLEPYYWNKKANLLANVMEQRWHIQGDMQCISKYPRWTINTTTYETGKDFRISSAYMGEQYGSFVEHPPFSLSHAIAASAGFPVFIGPYKLKTENYRWFDATGAFIVQPKDKILHLWDGGVYDNMGLDPLFTTDGDGALAKDINYLIVSNASGNIEHKTRRMSFSIDNLKRLLDINMDQVQVLKSKSVIDFFMKQHNGVYLKIGTTMEHLLCSCKTKERDKYRILHTSLNKQEVKKVADYKTSLHRMKCVDFHTIMRHGYELASTTLECYGNIEL